MKNDPDQHAAVSSPDDMNDEIDWELRPGGMLVQKRDDVVVADDDEGGAASRGPTIKITVSHGPARHELHLPAQSTFGKSSTTFGYGFVLGLCGLVVRFRCFWYSSYASQCVLRNSVTLRYENWK